MSPDDFYHGPVVVQGGLLRPASGPEPTSPIQRSDYDRGFDQGFRACLDQIALTGLTPTGEHTVKEFIRAARRRLGLEARS